MAETPGATPPVTGASWAPAAAALLLGVALRVAMGFESFWLDEAWSWAIAEEADSAWQVLTGFRHDNNHRLNTLYLYAVGDAATAAHWIVLRLPALAAGCLSLVFLGLVAREWGRVAMLQALVLASISFPLISASAQARGYALAIGASLAYVWVTRRAQSAGSAGGDAARIVALAALAAVGLLAHPTFVYPLAGAAAATAVDTVRGGAGPGQAVLRSARLHGLPLALSLALFAAFYADVAIGGGPLYERWVTVRQAAAQTLGFPRRGPLTWVAGAIVLVLSAQGLRTLWRRGERGWVAFFAVTLAVAPAAVILVSDPQLLYARYLLTAFPWFYVLAAIGLSALWTEPAGRVVAAAVVAAIAISNGQHTLRVLAEGRNDYLETLRFIDRRSDGDRVFIGSDHDFRNGTLLRFYAPRVPSRRPFVYVASDRWPPGGPEWYLRHDWKAGHDPERFHEPVPGLRYERVESFEHGPGDGFQWFVYRRSP